MTKKRISVLLNWMGLIDLYDLNRALSDLTQAEFEWEPHPGAWGITRREDCHMADPQGDPAGEWVADYDWATAESAMRGESVEPMTTIGWLLNHFGEAPGLAAQLEILGGPVAATPDAYQRMWGYRIIPTVDDAVNRFNDGWAALREALRSSTDDMLEQDYDGHPWKRGDRAISALLNEVSHHSTQICVLRDLFAHA